MMMMTRRRRDEGISFLFLVIFSSWFSFTSFFRTSRTILSTQFPLNPTHSRSKSQRSWVTNKNQNGMHRENEKECNDHRESKGKEPRVKHSKKIMKRPLKLFSGNHYIIRLWNFSLPFFCLSYCTSSPSVTLIMETTKEKESWSENKKDPSHSLTPSALFLPGIYSIVVSCSFLSNTRQWCNRGSDSGR